MSATFGFYLVVHRGGGTDKFGDPLPTTDHLVPGCISAAAGSTELVNRQQTVVTQDTIYAPYDADVVATDTVTIPAGQALAAGDYQVDGSPARYRNPFTGTDAGTVIRLKSATG